MTFNHRNLLALAFLTMSALPAFPQVSSAKTQAVFTVSQLGDRCATQFKTYERMKEGDRLLELDGSGRPQQIGITDSLRSELSRAIGGYLKALDSGWKASDPELAQARETIQATRVEMEKIGVWTCFQWDEGRLPDAARDGLDKIRQKAWEGALLVQAGKIDEAAKAFNFARELIGEHGEAIERELDRGKDVEDTRKHPAYARTVAEVDRLQASVKDELGKVQDEREQLKKDVAALHAVAEKAAPALREAQNSGGFSGTEEAIIDDVTRLREKLDAFEGGLGPQVREELASFKSSYGSDRDAIQASITRIMGGQALDVPQSPQFLVDQLDRGLNALIETRALMVAQLVAIGGRNSQADNPDAERREAAFARARQCLEMALQIDPGNAEAEKMLAGLGAGAGAASDKAEARLDAETWEDHSDRFQGPGKVASLAASAEEWLAGDAGWTKDKDILAVRINGDWLVAETDLMDRPTAWGLPIEAAFIRHSDRDADRDVAWVYRLTMVTRENEKAAPWKAARVGSNRQMRASKIDVAESDGPNMIFRLLLALALLSSGLLLVGPFVTSKVPALGSLYKLLVPLRPLIGVATLVIGAILLVLGILSPISDILPQAAAIVAGLFLGIELLLKKRSDSGAAVEKAQELLASQAGNIKKVEKVQVPLGVACLVLALIHLFAAQVTLF